MKITKYHLRKLVKEAIIAEAGYDQLPYKQGEPWQDPDVPVGTGAQVYDDLDTELTDEEIEAAMGMERADPAGDAEFWAGYKDALDGKGLPVSASPDYKAGWEDGSLDQVTESTIKEEQERMLAERINPALAEIERQLRYTLAEYIDTYMMSMNMNPGDASDRRRVSRKVSDIVGTIIGD
tara:strand:+ start:324 stop:863 length:540 start_codon:yes stop_codon:yes gene_type:complete